MPDTEAELLLDTVVVFSRPGAEGGLLALCRQLARRVVSANAQDPPRPSSFTGRVDVVLIDSSLSHQDALDLLPGLARTFAAAPVVVVSAEATLDWAVRLVRAGAHDYVAGPLQEHSIAGILARAREQRPGPAAQAGQDRYLCGICPPDVPIVGQSPAIRKVLASIKLAAQSRCDPLLILGETGTGKELAARAVHAWRSAADPADDQAPTRVDWDNFIAVNCAALTANLLESELFGHVRGAFTGADRDKTGLLELAGEGTIFLDEISEMHADLQAKLLRVLQEKTFRKVGGTRDLRCRAAILASSNRDLLAEVRAGRFRKDLYYRLAIFPIRMPSLRDQQRRDDVLLLADYFLHNSNIPSRSYVRSISRPAQLELLRHDWPGNVRELRNVIDRALILETTREITPFSLVFDRDEVSSAPARASDDNAGMSNAGIPACASGPYATLPDAPSEEAYGRPSVGIPAQAPAAGNAGIPACASAPGQTPCGLPPRGVTTNAPGVFSLEAAEREFILRALKETNWQRTRAAALLGITRATLLAKLKRYNLQPPQ